MRNEIVGYIYDVAYHCVSCAQKQYGNIQCDCGLDSNGVCYLHIPTEIQGELLDVVFSGEENDCIPTCEDCNSEIEGLRLTEWGIEREKEYRISEQNDSLSLEVFADCGV